MARLWCERHYELLTARTLATADVAEGICVHGGNSWILHLGDYIYRDGAVYLIKGVAAIPYQSGWWVKRVTRVPPKVRRAIVLIDLERERREAVDRMSESPFPANETRPSKGG